MAAKSGAITGYPLVDFKVQLVDGSHHAVDSDEHSFRAAGHRAFRAAMEKVRPSLLEPVMDVENAAPQEYSGDIMGDLNSRRGRVQGMETSGKQKVIKAQVPMAGNAQLPINTKLHHCGAWFLPHAVFALRSSPRTTGPKDR